MRPTGAEHHDWNRMEWVESTVECEKKRPPGPGCERQTVCPPVPAALQRADPPQERKRANELSRTKSSFFISPKHRSRGRSWGGAAEGEESPEGHTARWPDPPGEGTVCF